MRNQNVIFKGEKSKINNKVIHKNRNILKCFIRRSAYYFYPKKSKSEFYYTFNSGNSELIKKCRDSKYILSYIYSKICCLKRNSSNVKNYLLETNDTQVNNIKVGLIKLNEEKEKNLNYIAALNGINKASNMQLSRDEYAANSDATNENTPDTNEKRKDISLPTLTDNDKVTNSPLFLSCCNRKEKEKIILVIGVTCSGKTKFSIDLCKELLNHNIEGEIISADSMQVYQDFSVGIAKVDEDEKRDIKHHMLDVCELNQEFNAHKFINYTIPIIKNININKKVAIVTGGTLLYIESLLWESVVDLREKREEEKAEQLPGERVGEKVKDKYEHKTNDELHEELKRVDEERANQLHKNDRKRICRSLDIFYTYNKKHSELIKMKNHKNNNIEKTRYLPCLFYLDYNNDDILKEQIEKRVNDMILKGLLDEAIKLKEMNNTKDVKLLGKGIYQSIAYKEFDTYIENKIINKIDDEKLFNICKDNLIRKTYKYAKRQRRWVFNRFVKNYSIPLNKIDVSTNYTQQLSNALQIVLNFLKS
ncbi:tRNA dimethylallyltransferase [Plasmodium brasilianum]|uniref:tRNA dimethylallyltransferase n=2 Tax=Plasmodium (Plasmodium) TaxID=418103 RepID=A0A1A8WDD5_PLAMA|nr:tRNA delta(2)-isopentenylpyrophosphate transferase, putative [Plasmodium malariae]KAI4835603.1 tRNA dimethylallyltransferase [Plasmodium brasilianum]SBS89221.1 tRNA delta(2)-isopentenylpyrophosphate [Plasmodium malariae]SCP02528.1 tRNA delta(2)-isopentenylpyrophosphate transferase, putative [Plasmodium malariae]